MALLEMIEQQLDANTVRQMGERVGVDPDKTGQAINAALPMLLAAMARNTSDPNGAAGLAEAIDQDHDGSLLDNVPGYLNAPSGRAADGDGILRHVLGGRRSQVEEGLGNATGLNASQIARLLPLLAPVVMAALGRLKKKQNLDAGGLAGVLGGEQREMQQRTPGILDALEGLLDRNRDGSMMDDVLGGVFGSRR